MSIVVKYISAEEAREKQAEQYKDNPDTLEAIRESSNEMSATLRVFRERIEQPAVIK